MWQSLLSLKITPDWNVCEDWENIVRIHVNRRVYAVVSDNDINKADDGMIVILPNFKFIICREYVTVKFG